jgi:hypothetical protein
LARDIKECRFSEIEWIWIVEAKRKATAEEIRQLGDGKIGQLIDPDLQRKVSGNGLAKKAPRG